MKPNPITMFVKTIGYICYGVLPCMICVTRLLFILVFQIGVISGQCGNINGFDLDRYADPTDIKAHVSKISQTKLPALVEQLTTEGYSVDHGGRVKASKVAVLFVGGKYPKDELKRRMREAEDKAIKLYIVNLDDANRNLQTELSSSDPNNNVLSGQPMETLAREFVMKLCKED